MIINIFEYQNTIRIEYVVHWLITFDLYLFCSSASVSEVLSAVLNFIV